jgi:hypothetical protein
MSFSSIFTSYEITWLIVKLLAVYDAAMPKFILAYELWPICPASLGWVVWVCHGKSELLDAMQPCSTTMTHGSFVLLPHGVGGLAFQVYYGRHHVLATFSTSFSP